MAVEQQNGAERGVRLIEQVLQRVMVRPVGEPHPLLCLVEAEPPAIDLLAADPAGDGAEPGAGAGRVGVDVVGQPIEQRRIELERLAIGIDVAPGETGAQQGGAERGRGYIEGRFRDRSLWAGTIEYRFWVVPRGFALSPWTPHVRVERLGLALFYDVGAVADRWWELFESTPRNSLGMGFRATLERSAPFRVDVGFSNEGVEVTAGFGLSF